MTKIAVGILGACGVLVLAGMAQDSTVPVQVSGEGDASTQSGPVSEPGQGLHYGPLRISAELSLSLTHDFNPTYSDSHAQGITTFHAQPLLDLLLNGNSWNAYGRGWLTRDWYLDAKNSTYQDIVSKQHYGIGSGVSYETPRGTRLGLTEFFEYQNRNNYVMADSGTTGPYNASWQDRYSLLLGASLDTRLSEKSGLSLGASYSDLWYDNPMLYSWRSIGGSAGLSRKISDKTDAVLDFGYDQQWSDGSKGISESYRALIGVGSRATAKSTYRAEVGVMGYDFANNSDTAYSWTYNLSGQTHLSPRMSVNVSGTANFQPSETDKNNYTLVQTISGGLTYEATRRLTTSMNAVYRHEDYAKPDAGGGGTRIDTQVSLYGRASYRVFRYTSVFVGADISVNGSTLSIWDYDRLFLEAGVNLRF
jgi:hypothetical protein